MTARSVLVASPSAVQRSRAAALIAGLPGFSISATTADLSETFNCAEIHPPDLVVIAEDFTRLAEFSVMQALFAALGAAWVLLGQSGAPGRAQAAPAIDLAMPPDHLARVLQAAVSAPRQAAAPTATGKPMPGNPPARTTAGNYDKLVVIGSSTGGVDALITLLADFPADCPATAIVQHTGRGFSDSLVQVLRRRCKAQVVAAQDGVTLQPGKICLAGGLDGHLTIASGAPPKCQVRPGPPVSGHLPSIDMLFRSALPLAPRLVGVILTGMGQDGAAGLLDLRRAGATTIGQDEATSVVYGMPKAAWDRGAVQTQLPLPRIAEEILRAAAASSTPQSDRRMVAR